MKVKKLVALFIAATMIVFPTSVFADSTTPGDGGTATGGGDIEGYVVEEAFLVTLPTVAASSLDFLLDPQALLAISNTDYDGLITPGAIVFTAQDPSVPDPVTYSPVISATNKSSYDVLLNVDVELTNDVTNPVTVVETAGAVNDDDALNVYFAAIPEQKYSTVSDYTTSVPSTTVALPVDSSTLDTNFSFLLNGDQTNYEIVFDSVANPGIYAYEPIATPVWDSVGFTLTGLCNENADWDAFNTANGALSCDVTWTMTAAAGDETLYEVSEGVPAGDDAYGLIAPEVVITPVAPSISVTEYALDASTAEDVTVDFGAGTAIATDITSVTDGGTPLTETDDYTLVGTTLSFTSEYVDAVLATGADKELVVNFDDTDTTSVTITLTVPDVVASVTPANVTFSKATGATVAVVLGSGSGLSDGITRLDTVVSDTDYIWADGTWSLSGTTLTLSNTAAITNLAVSSTRTVKVTFESGATDTFVVTIAN